MVGVMELQVGRMLSTFLYDKSDKIETRMHR